MPQALDSSWSADVTHPRKTLPTERAATFELWGFHVALDGVPKDPGEYVTWFMYACRPMPTPARWRPLPGHTYPVPLRDVDRQRGKHNFEDRPPARTQMPRRSAGYGLVPVVRAMAEVCPPVAPPVLKFACNAWALRPHVDRCPPCATAARPDLTDLLACEGLFGLSRETWPSAAVAPRPRMLRPARLRLMARGRSSATGAFPARVLRSSVGGRVRDCCR